MMTNPNQQQGNGADQPHAPLYPVTQVLAGYAPGFRLVKGLVDSSVDQFTVVPAQGMPRLLLPTQHAAMATALKSFVGRHRLVSAAPSVLKLVSKLAGGKPVLTRDVSLIGDDNRTSPLRDLFASVVGRTDFELAFRLSVGRPNAKTVAMAITAEGEALCFAKFGSEAMTNSLVAFEGKVLEHFNGRDLSVLMPRVLYSGMWAGDHNVLITEPVNISVLKRQATIAHQAADDFTMASPVTHTTLRASTYWRSVLDRIGSIRDQPENVAMLSRAAEAIDGTWGNTEFHFGYSHGDWSRANLGIVDGKLVALDWERCTPDAPRGIDIAHFAIIETSSSRSNRLLDLERIEAQTRRYLGEIGRSPSYARPLIVFDLVEMMLRFSNARAVGLPSKDSNFGAALHAALLQWTL